MKITQVRNATLVIEYAGARFLVDPMLSDQGTMPPFQGEQDSTTPNPLVPLPIPIAQLAEVDAVIMTHLHTDHFDEAAAQALPKTLPVFVQNEQDAEAIRKHGFEDVRVMAEDSAFGGVGLSRTGGRHGPDEAYALIGERLGFVSGVVFTHPDERRLYLVGDSIWNDDVQGAIARHEPEVIILNAGRAGIRGVGPILMGTEDVRAVHRAAPQAELVASHMEAVNHCLLSRADLRAFAAREGFAARLQVPEDGETLAF